MFLKKIFFIFLFFLIQINSENEITIFATDEVIAGCEGGFYLIELQVEYSAPFDNYFSFLLELENPAELKLKCFIQYKNSTITCIGNLNSNDFDVEIGEFIEFPIIFPDIEGIKWDYKSFARNIYGKGWFIDEEDCLIKNNEDFNQNEWGLIFNITDIIDNKCVDVENKYIFKIEGNFIQGELMNDILNENDEIEILQDIWVPILLKSSRIIFRKIEELSFAFCPFKFKLSKSNINDKFEFDCEIPIPEGRLLIGNIKIQSFYDFFYIKTKDEIFLENISFTINRTSEIFSNFEDKNNNDITTNISQLLTKNDKEKIDEKKLISENYFILGENETNSEKKIYCPNKPLFRIVNSQKDIKLVSSELKDYTFSLQGILFIENKNDSKYSYTYNEISFDLQVFDNLAEGGEGQNTKATCTLPIGTQLYKKIAINCKTQKISEESKTTNDTDFFLDIYSEKNRTHQDLIIRWPEEIKK